MLKWIKKLWKRYYEFTIKSYEEKPPVIYKVGNKRFVKRKRFSKGPVPRTRYEK